MNASYKIFEISIIEFVFTLLNIVFIYRYYYCFPDHSTGEEEQCADSVFNPESQLCEIYSQTKQHVVTSTRYHYVKENTKNLYNILSHISYMFTVEKSQIYSLAASEDFQNISKFISMNLIQDASSNV